VLGGPVISKPDITGDLDHTRPVFIDREEDGVNHRDGVDLNALCWYVGWAASILPWDAGGDAGASERYEISIHARLVTTDSEERAVC